MTKHKIIPILILFFLTLFSCEQFESKLRPSKIEWISKKGYNLENVVKMRAKGKVPAPETQVGINGQLHWLALDITQPYLILKENEFNLSNFAPTRIVSIVQGNNEMLMEDGYIKDISILGTDYDETHCSLLKSSSRQYHCKGLIGRNYYKSTPLTIDFKNGALAYADDEKIQSLDNSSKIPLLFKNSEDIDYQVPYFYGAVDSMKVLMTLNTFERFSQISPELARELNYDSDQEYIKIKELQIHQFRTTNLKCKINENLLYSSPKGDEILEFSLGLNALQNRLVTIDMPDSCFYLEKAPKAPKKPETQKNQQ